MEAFTRTPNNIIDTARLNPYQFQLFVIIVRKTDGWCKVEDGISLSQFEKLVTFKKNKIVLTLKDLIDLQLIEKTKHYNEEKKQYSFSTYKVSQRVVSENNKGSISQIQGVVSDKYKQKKLITKETNTTKDAYSLMMNSLESKVKFKSKISNGKVGKELFKAIKDKSTLEIDYINHQVSETNFSKTINNYMKDYETVYKQSGTSEVTKENMNNNFLSIPKGFN